MKKINNRYSSSHENEKIIRKIMGTAQDGFWRVGSNMSILDVNHAYCMMSGYSRGELLELTINEIDDKQSYEDISATIQHIKEQGTAAFETRHRRKDGSLFEVSVSVTCINCDPIDFVCFFRDITERKQSDKRILGSHNLMRYVIEIGRASCRERV